MWGSARSRMFHVEHFGDPEVMECMEPRIEFLQLCFLNYRFPTTNGRELTRFEFGQRATPFVIIVSIRGDSDLPRIPLAPPPLLLLMFRYPKDYDVLVIGAGHAGIEAALAAARESGRRSAMITQNLDTIGQMSCNPAIGGLAKGHMVREIDALGGFMAENADATGIQFRLLNAGKGPSVRAPRAQCDKKAYQFRAKHEIEASPGVLTCTKAMSSQLLGRERRGLRGIVTTAWDGNTWRQAGGDHHRHFHARLDARRQAEPNRAAAWAMAISTLSDHLKALGFAVDRFKTGTPCRLNGRSIDFSRSASARTAMPTVPGFSYERERIASSAMKGIMFTAERLDRSGLFHVRAPPLLDFSYNQRPCTHDVILAESRFKSPMYSGVRSRAS